MAVTFNNDGMMERIPAGATFYPRVPDRAPSFELAQELARRGASAMAIRAVGGPEAVARLLNRDGSLKSA